MVVERGDKSVGGVAREGEMDRASILRLLFVRCLPMVTPKGLRALVVLVEPEEGQELRD